MWSLYRAQTEQGHKVRFLWGKAKSLPSNATVYKKGKSIESQIGDWPDIVHFHYPYFGELHKPFICTEHFGSDTEAEYPLNTVFVSRKHAETNGADCFVYNGLDWSRYGEPGLNGASILNGAPKWNASNGYFHFLGKARLPTKNLKGAINIAKLADVRLHVLGGPRLYVGRRGSYFYADKRIRFHGMVGGPKKHDLIRESRGLICPVRWHEPFGLVFIESLYLGTPVFATPYGSLPELIDSPDIGFLSSDSRELAAAIMRVSDYDRRHCHEVAKSRFGADTMASNYMTCYERVMGGERLNSRVPKTKGGMRELLPFT